MKRVADYLTRALSLDAKAAKATGVYKAQLQALAAQWRDLARQAQILSEFEQRLEQKERKAATDSGDRPQGECAQSVI